MRGDMIYMICGMIIDFPSKSFNRVRRSNDGSSNLNPFLFLLLLFRMNFHRVSIEFPSKFPSNFHGISMGFWTSESVESPRRVLIGFGSNPSRQLDEFDGMMDRIWWRNFLVWRRVGKRSLWSVEASHMQQSGPAAAQSGDPEERHRIHRITGGYAVGLARSSHIDHIDRLVRPHPPR